MPRNLQRFDYVFLGLTFLCFGVRCGRTSDTVISLPSSKQDCALQALQTATPEDADARYDTNYTSGVCSLAAEP